MQAILRLILTLAGFFVLDAAVFRSGFYLQFLNPDSVTGQFERILMVERDRRIGHPNQVVGIGNSRMALMPSVANDPTQETGYAYATLAVPGTPARVWYYMLRDADPDANRYSAVVVALDNYNDDETWEDHPDRAYDTRILAARLRLTDLVEYPGSFRSWDTRWDASRSILFRSSEFGRDVRDLLLDPRARLAAAKESREKSAVWLYGYGGSTATMEDAHIDWQNRIIDAPGRTPAQLAAYEAAFFRPNPPNTGIHSKYMHYWLGRIHQHYKGSRTRLIFVRLPRGPWVRPDFPPTNPTSSVRELASGPGVTLIDEHYFDPLERPELFADEMHLNHAGMDQFTRMLSREVGRIMGPPKQ